MTKLQELSLDGEAEPTSGHCIRTKHGWRGLTPTVCVYRYAETDQQPWDIKYDRDKDPKYNPELRTNKIASPEGEDGRYRDGFIVKDGVEWTPTMWQHFLSLQKDNREGIAARINRRGGGEDYVKVPNLSRAGRFDKWGVKVMT